MEPRWSLQWLARVPKLTIMIGGSFGAGNYSMCGRAYSPGSFGCGQTPVYRSWAASRPPRCWPRCAVTSSSTRGESWSTEDEEAFKAPIRQQYEEQGHPYYATTRLWDDGIIDPLDTRDALGLALSVCANAPLEPISYGVFRM